MALLAVVTHFLFRLRPRATGYLVAMCASMAVAAVYRAGQALTQNVYSSAWASFHNVNVYWIMSPTFELCATPNISTDTQYHPRHAPRCEPQQVVRLYRSPSEGDARAEGRSGRRGADQPADGPHLPQIVKGRHVRAGRLSTRLPRAGVMDTLGNDRDVLARRLWTICGRVLQRSRSRLRTFVQDRCTYNPTILRYVPMGGI